MTERETSFNRSARSTTAVLVLPHQLFSPHPAAEYVADGTVYLSEDPLIYRQFTVLPAISAYRRAAATDWVAAYERRDRDARRRRPIKLVPAEHLPRTESIAAILRSDGVRRVVFVDPVDDWIETRLRGAFAEAAIEVEILDSPGFLLSREEIRAVATPEGGSDGTPTVPRMAEFYIGMRRRLDILITADGGPIGGVWSLDRQNRKKIPRGMTPPRPTLDEEGETASSDGRGTLSPLPYPTTGAGASLWLDTFLEGRLRDFGDYEDAIDRRDDRWFHSVLTPMLNIGLLTPREIVDRTLDFGDAAERDGNPVPLNSLEGFVRQVIGWREYMRLAYVAQGRRMRSRNYWNHHRPMPSSFYEGSTGLAPFDAVVAKTHRLAWAHHIERLMVAGNLMLLCEIDPDAVYRWFMELFVDAYDWVMVPNVYGMSQFSDGGSITTKPYISGSNYIRKMSDTPPGGWQEIWDGLYWRFIEIHRDRFAANARTTMSVRSLDRLDTARRARIISAAESFLASL